MSLVTLGGSVEVNAQPCRLHFNPAESELIGFLNLKARGRPYPSKIFICRDLYGSEAPWEIFKDQDPWVETFPRDSRKKCIYVYTQLKYLSQTSRHRFSRRSGKGSWHGATAPKDVVREATGEEIGMMKMFVYESNNESMKGMKGHWIMHEFSLKDPTLGTNWVLCRITRDGSKTLKTKIVEAATQTSRPNLCNSVDITNGFTDDSRKRIVNENNCESKILKKRKSTKKAACSEVLEIVPHVVTSRDKPNNVPMETFPDNMEEVTAQDSDDISTEKFAEELECELLLTNEREEGILPDNLEAVSAQDSDDILMENFAEDLEFELLVTNEREEGILPDNLEEVTAQDLDEISTEKFAEELEFELLLANEREEGIPLGDHGIDPVGGCFEQFKGLAHYSLTDVLDMDFDVSDRLDGMSLTDITADLEGKLITNEGQEARVGDVIDQVVGLDEQLGEGPVYSITDKLDELLIDDNKQGPARGLEQLEGPSCYSYPDLLDMDYDRFEKVSEDKLITDEGKEGPPYCSSTNVIDMEFVAMDLLDEEEQPEEVFSMSLKDMELGLDFNDYIHFAGLMQNI